MVTWFGGFWAFFVNTTWLADTYLQGYAIAVLLNPGQDTVDGLVFEEECTDVLVT